jgi:hypothetical protein
LWLNCQIESPGEQSLQFVPFRSGVRAAVHFPGPAAASASDHSGRYIGARPRSDTAAAAKPVVCQGTKPHTPSYAYGVYMPVVFWKLLMTVLQVDYPSH